MAAPTTLPVLLSSLTESLSSALEVAPKLEGLVQRPKDGISLLDVKNELLLSYLQNLVFLILIKLRNARSQSENDEKNQVQECDAVRAKLVELRLYLEKGARPLEEKLKFSIERFLRLAADTQREEESKKKHGKYTAMNENRDTEPGSDSERDDDDDDDDDNVESEEERVHPKSGDMSAAPSFSTMVDDITVRPTQHEDGPVGTYHPPKRERHVMESTQRGERAGRRPNRSHTMEEFINSEFSNSPLAEPSIGTTITQGGRRTKSAGERKEEAERQEYEETNFVRLPKESKKERAKKNKQSGRDRRMMFGGEEWHDLGEGVDRIDRLTKRKDVGGRGANVKAMLDKSRKRGVDTVDGPKGSGQMGERFRKRVKVLESGRRDRGKNR